MSKVLKRKRNKNEVVRTGNEEKKNENVGEKKKKNFFNFDSTVTNEIDSQSPNDFKTKRQNGKQWRNVKRITIAFWSYGNVSHVLLSTELTTFKRENNCFCFSI